MIQIYFSSRKQKDCILNKESHLGLQASLCLLQCLRLWTGRVQIAFSSTDLVFEFFSWIEAAFCHQFPSENFPSSLDRKVLPTSSPRFTNTTSLIRSLVLHSRSQLALWTSTVTGFWVEAMGDKEQKQRLGELLWTSCLSSFVGLLGWILTFS